MKILYSILCFLAVLAFLAPVVQGSGQEFVQGPGQAAASLAFSDLEEPGSIILVNLTDNGSTPVVVFTRSYGGIESFAVSPSGEIFFSEGRGIFRVAGRSEERIYAHTSDVRDLALREAEGGTRLYFSDVSGEGGNGHIYYLDDAMGRILYANIGVFLMLQDIGGYWDGFFTFDDSENLYLSSGSYRPASIFCIPGAGPDFITGRAAKIYTDPDGDVNGIQYRGQRAILFSNGSSIFSLDTESLAKVHLGISARSIGDLSISEGKPRAGIFIGSSMSNKYHRPGCIHAERIKEENAVWFPSPEDAKSKGYEACKVCRPP